MTAPGVSMRVETAAKFYGVSVFTIRRWCKAGKLKCEKDPGGRCWRVLLLFTPPARPPGT